MSIPRQELAPPFAPLIRATLERLDQARIVARLWAKDHRVWRPEPREIADRLGWLTVPEAMREQLDALRSLDALTRQQRTTDVVLLGMGGSSLGPEVLRASFPRAEGAPRLWVLDSTVPGWVRRVSRAITPARTLFLVASKSGGTIEVLSLFAHFWQFVSRTTGHQGGGQFLAITDPGTSLEALAREHGFARIFSNPPDIGGRYSVLSLFGLVPATLMGLDVARLLARAAAMAQRCRTGEARANPGAYLGAVMGALAKTGRDKVTLIASKSLATFGLWAEQLLAESTGKDGTGLIPVAQEPVTGPNTYGRDRLFVYLRLKGDDNGLLDRQVHALAKGDHPVLRFDLMDQYDLAAEFFRWEFATAIAGHVLGIQPFDQPNVQESKDNTNRVLQTIEATGRLPEEPPRSPRQAAEELRPQLTAGRYVALLAYTMPSRSFEQAIRRLRRLLIDTYHVATTFGYGPRYLHSTGQLHKGGPASGLFVELVDRMKPDVAIPGRAYSFGTLARAQAAGDLQSLTAHRRPAVRIDLGPQPAATVRALQTALALPRSSRSPTRSPKRRKTRRR